MKTHVQSAILIVMTLLIIPLQATAADGPTPVLKPGDRVGICGDSITEQKMYSAFIDAYLVMCQPQLKLQAAQFGWSGETTWGFKSRISKDVLYFKPTVVTTCYGMNDAGYGPLNPDLAKNYRESTLDIVRQLKGAGVRVIVLGSPGVVDSETFRNNAEQAIIYNKTLRSFGDIDKEIAAAEGCVFADVHDVMMQAMTRFKAANPGVPFAGGDGVHPGENGHLAMAYAFLKALGCDGNIGTVTVDLTGKKAEASEGHDVVSFDGRTLELQSSRYAFAVPGDVTHADSAKASLPFLPFNEDLNRFVLKVPGVTGSYKVTWGAVTKTFTAEQLTSGVNLAVEFLDHPFTQTFNQIFNMIREKQNLETTLTKDWLHNAEQQRKNFPEAGDAFDRIAQAGVTAQQRLNDAVTKAVVPIKHSIVIEPAN